MSVNLAKLAAEVAPTLPEGPWTVRPPREEAHDSHAILERADGATVWISGNGWTRNGRLSVSGGWPRTKAGEVMGPREGRPSITVAETRPSAGVAAEIARRFLPDYLRLYAEALAKKVSWDDSRAAKRAACREMAAEIGGKVQGETDANVHWYHDYGSCGDATPGSEDTWSFKIHGVGAKAAREIARLVRSDAEERRAAAPKEEA